MQVSRWLLPATTVALALACASTADAQVQGRPRLKVIDHGAQIEVVVSGVRLADAPVMTLNRERIELPLAGRPLESNMVYERGLVMRIDVRGDVRGEGVRSLSVKLRRDAAGVAALARGTTATQADDGVHLWLPVKAPAADAVAAPVAGAAGAVVPAVALAAVPAAPKGASNGTTVSMTGTTGNTTPTGRSTATGTGTGTGSDSFDSALADAHAALRTNGTPDPTTGTVAGSGSGPGSVPGSDPAAGSTTVTGTASLLTGSRSPTAKAAPITGGGSGGPGFGRVVIAVLAIALAGGAIVALRRKRGAAPTATGPQLEILASRSLGGKTRVVWLGAGDRELVVAIAAQHVNLLGQWRRGEADRPVDRALERSQPMRLEAVAAEGEPSFATGSTPMARVRGTSTAVSGIMRLRGKVTPITDEVATGDTDADEQWARDILAATGGRR